MRPGLPGVGPSTERLGPFPPHAHHHARLSPAELDVQRVAIDAGGDEEGVQALAGHLRGHLGGTVRLVPPVRDPQLLCQVQALHRPGGQLQHGGGPAGVVRIGRVKGK